jgi:hypothetical protein
VATGLYGGSSGAGGGLYGATVESQRRQYAAFAALPAVQQQALLAQIRGADFQAAPDEDEESFFGKLIPHHVELAASQIADALIHSPGAAYKLGRAVTHDVFVDPWESRHEEGLHILPHTTPIVKESAAAIKYDVLHPGERPGYLALDVLSAGAVGAGVAGRVAAAGRGIGAVRAARRGGPEGPGYTASPRPRPEPPKPDEPGFSARLTTAPDELPVRSPSTILSEVGGPGPEPPPLVRGVHYTVAGPKGGFAAYFERTAVRGDKEVHYFRTPEGKTKQISAHLVSDLKMTPGQIKPTYPGERINMYDLPEGELPPRAPRGAAVEPAKAAPSPQEFRQAERVERELETTAAAPAETVPIEIKFEEIPNKPGEKWMSVGESERVGYVKQGNYYAMRYEKMGATPAVKPFRTEAEAAAAAHRLADRIINKPKGGAVVPGRSAYLTQGVRGLITKPASRMREIEVFKEQEPRYLAPGEKLDAADAARLDEMRMKYPEVAERLASPTAKGQLEGQTAIETEGRASDLPINIVERTLPRTSIRRPGEKTLGVGTVTKTDVLLSRNPGFALAHNMWMDIMERFPEKRIGPWRRDMSRYVAFNKKEAGRALGVLNAAREAGLSDQVKHVDDLIKGGATSERILAAVDSMNMLAKLWLLYVKPGYYIANFMGQSLLQAADHGWSPVSMARSWRIQWDLFTGNEGVAHLRARAIRHAMGENMGVSLADDAAGLGIMRRVREKVIPDVTIRGRKLQNIGSYRSMSRIANKLLDTPFRDNAFITEARRHGYTDAEKIGKLIDDAIAEDPAAVAKFVEISRRANRNLIDYARLGPSEKRWVRRVVFFYPWFKGASIYAGHLLAEHPAQAFVAAQMGEYGKKRSDIELGPLPGFLEGVFKVGEKEVPGLGKQPLVVNPAAVTVLGTPGQVLNTAMGAIGGGGTSESALGQYLTPALSAGVAAATKRDPFTGAEYEPKMGDLDIFVEQLKGQVVPTHVYEQYKRATEIAAGTRDPTQTLYPYSPDQPIGRAVLSVYPYSLNVNEARSRAFAERRSLASRREREVLKNKDYRDRYAEAGRTTGLFQETPSDLTQAFGQRSRLASETAAYEASLDRPMRMIDRLQVVLGLLVNQGVFDDTTARQTLEQMLALPDSQIESYKSKLTNAYFGGEVISRYRTALNASGANLTVP